MSLSAKKKVCGSFGCLDDQKMEQIIPGIVAVNNHTNNCHLHIASQPATCNTQSTTTNHTGSKTWFSVNDKLDVSHDQEWYRAQVKDIDGYSIYVAFQGQNGRICKWIKNCNQIFKYICQCAKECQNNIHVIAAYGAQTNYSYDEQIVLTDPYCVAFHDIMHTILFKFIAYNIRDATSSANQFNQDFTSIHQNISKCHSMSILLQKYQDTNQALTLSFKTASEIQQNTTTNAITLGQYVKYIKTCNQLKFKNAIKREHDDIKNISDSIIDIDAQIKQLMKQQNEFKTRKNHKMNTLKQLKFTRDKQKGFIQTLEHEQVQCVDKVTQATNILHQYWAKHKHIIRDLHTEKLKEFEKEFMNWDKHDTIAWIMMIDNQRFLSNHKYSKFRKMLNKSRITGASLNDLTSDLFLKYVGLGIESRTALINNINRVTTQNDDQ